MALRPGLLAFIGGHIPSVWALEALLLLRNTPDLRWNCERAARELRSNPNLLARILAGFETSGLVVKDGEGYFYAPAAPLLDELSAELETVYRERPLAVINAIVSSKPDRIRIFADAFRFFDGPKK